jgi:hypothetical protein
MNWKLPLVILSIGALTSCGSSPKSDAEKVCDCGSEIATLMNNNASKDEIETKWKECDDLHTTMENKYKDDADKLKEFNDAGKACSEKLEEELSTAQKKWEAAHEKE